MEGGGTWLRDLRRASGETRGPERFSPAESRGRPWRGRELTCCPPTVRPLRPAFPAQESTTPASAPEARSCYQHQSALPHSGGALAGRRAQVPLASREPGQLRARAWPPRRAWACGACKAPPASATATGESRGGRSPLDLPLFCWSKPLPHNPNCF